MHVQNPFNQKKLLAKYKQENHPQDSSQRTLLPSNFKSLGVEEINEALISYVSARSK